MLCNYLTNCKQKSELTSCLQVLSRYGEGIWWQHSPHFLNSLHPPLGAKTAWQNWVHVLMCFLEMRAVNKACSLNRQSYKNKISGTHFSHTSKSKLNLYFVLQMDLNHFWFKYVVKKVEASGRDLPSALGGDSKVHPRKSCKILLQNTSSSQNNSEFMDYISELSFYVQRFVVYPICQSVWVCWQHRLFINVLISGTLSISSLLIKPGNLSLG